MMICGSDDGIQHLCSRYLARPDLPSWETKTVAATCPLGRQRKSEPGSGRELGASSGSYMSGGNMLGVGGLG